MGRDRAIVMTTLRFIRIVMLAGLAFGQAVPAEYDGVLKSLASKGISKTTS